MHHKLESKCILRANITIYDLKAEIIDISYWIELDCKF